MKDKFCLKDMVKFFIKTQPEIKKFWKKKSKELTSKFELENVNEEEEIEEVQKVQKTKNVATLTNQKLLNKKHKRGEDSDDDEEISEKSEKLVKKNKNTPAVQNGGSNKNKTQNGKVAKKEESSDEEEEEIKNVPIPSKKANGNNNNNLDKTPFKRIDNSLKGILPETLQDNSYDSFMNQTGENYGQQANEKLKFTKGRDFKKEKTKFKNKTAFGGLSISTEVRSIPLDDD
jgi:hypothetical protein